MEKGLTGFFKHLDIAVAQIYADVLLPAARASFRFKGDLVHARDVADFVAPEPDDLGGGHVAFVRRLHDDFHVDEVLAADVGFDPFGNQVQVVLLEHPVGGFRDFVGDFRGLIRCGADGQGHTGFDFVGGDFRHHDHAHMVAVAVAADHQQQRNG